MIALLSLENVFIIKKTHKVSLKNLHEYDELLYTPVVDIYLKT
jgi:hypothetical protein